LTTNHTNGAFADLLLLFAVCTTLFLSPSGGEVR
jgi:hypothetical protein